MSLLPRTLLGRTIIIIVFIMIITQILANYLFRQFYVARHMRQSITLLGQNLQNIHNALVSLPPAERENFLRRISAHQRLFYHPQAQGELSFPAMTTSLQLKQQLEPFITPSPDGKIDIRMQRHGTPTLWVRMHAQGQSFWVGVPYKSFDHTLPVAWMMWLITGIIFAILGSIWLVRRINKPLGDLTKAAIAIGSGEQPDKLNETGPKEIQQLSRAFNKMAEDIKTLTSNRVLLLAGVSHDLRTPLARLRLAIEMLSKSNYEDFKEEMISDIEDMDNIIDQFLMYVRDGSGEPFSDGDINSILENVAKRYQNQGITITLQLSPLPKFCFKPISMRRLLINLISNAYKHAGEDIEIHTYQRDDMITIDIMDRGPGIASAEQDKLLQPFTQANAVEDSHGGTGLGLAIVDRIVAVHHGKFHLLAREGGGLIARVSLPLHNI